MASHSPTRPSYDRYLGLLFGRYLSQLVVQTQLTRPDPYVLNPGWLLGFNRALDNLNSNYPRPNILPRALGTPESIAQLAPLAYQDSPQEWLRPVELYQSSLLDKAIIIYGYALTQIVRDDKPDLKVDFPDHKLYSGEPSDKSLAKHSGEPSDKSLAKPSSTKANIAIVKTIGLLYHVLAKEDLKFKSFLVSVMKIKSIDYEYRPWVCMALGAVLGAKMGAKLIVGDPELKEDLRQLATSNTLEFRQTMLRLDLKAGQPGQFLTNYQLEKWKSIYPQPVGDCPDVGPPVAEPSTPKTLQSAPIPIKWPVTKSLTLGLIALKRKLVLDGARAAGIKDSFETLSNAQLKTICDLYDKHFFDGHIAYLLKAKNKTFNFKMSRKLTRVAAHISCKDGVNYYLTMSLPIMGGIFRGAQTEYKANGLLCNSRLTCMCSTIEHELVHLLMLVTRTPIDAVNSNWSCHGKLFMGLTLAYFGHTEFRHALIEGSSTVPLAEMPKPRIGQVVNVQFKIKGSPATTAKATVLKLNPKTVKVKLLPPYAHLGEFNTPYQFVTF